MILEQNKYISNASDMSDTFFKISYEDEMAAQNLYQCNLYNQAIYFLLQSMEKYVKYYICKKVDMTNVYFANKVREDGHSIDASIDFLIEIIAGNDKTLEKQIGEQIRHKICKDIKFSAIHNAVRYPKYSQHYKNYKVLIMSAKDYDELYKIYQI